ncbi:MAG: hypothetical protein U0Z44_04225 [Kouleothrix sp.]
MLFLDADGVTPELRDDRHVLAADVGKPAGYRIPRQPVLRPGVARRRLVPRPPAAVAAAHQRTTTRHARYTSSPSRAGRPATSAGHLLHLNIERLDELWHKQRAYAAGEAQMLFPGRWRRARWRNSAARRPASSSGAMCGYAVGAMGRPGR